MFAAYAGTVPIVRILLTRDVNLHLLTKVLMHCAGSWGWRTRVLTPELLCTQQRGKDAYQLATEAGHLEICELIRRKGAACGVLTRVRVAPADQMVDGPHGGDRRGRVDAGRPRGGAAGADGHGPRRPTFRERPGRGGPRRAGPCSPGQDHAPSRWCVGVGADVGWVVKEVGREVGLGFGRDGCRVAESRWAVWGVESDLVIGCQSLQPVLLVLSPPRPPCPPPSPSSLSSPLPVLLVLPPPRPPCPPPSPSSLSPPPPQSRRGPSSTSARGSCAWATSLRA